MKKTILILIFFSFIFSYSYSQCRDFTHDEVVPKLGDFLLTGKYHSMKLREGEEILIFKTVNRGLAYRFVVMSQSVIPQPHFMITDWENNVIYDNSKDNNSAIYDYQPKTTQRIKIIIKIPKSSNKTNIKDGCVGLVMGVKTD